MDVDAQIQALIQQAPQDGITPGAVEAIAPALKFIAGQLTHPQYYILQTIEQGWVMTTLSHTDQPNVEKNIIYAYPTLKDALANPTSRDPQLMALPIPVTHILFQMVAMSRVDSAIFFETAGNLNQATEVTRDNLQSIIQMHLQPQQGSRVPNDIA